MKVFNDTTALAAATLTAGQMVSVKEVGEYRIKASGSGITLANGRVAVPVASGTAVNVKQFGAVGDGVADDLAAFNAAGATGNPVFVPSDSTYNLSGSPTGTFYSNGTVTTTGAGTLDYVNNSAGIVIGNDGKKYRIVSCVLRQDTDGSGWYAINDSSHAPIGLDPTTPVTESGGDIVLNYDFTTTKIGSLVISADEGYANTKLTFGASVGTSSALISLYHPFWCRVSGTAIVAHSYFGAKGGDWDGTFDVANGTWVITHPSESHSDSTGSACIVQDDETTNADGQTVITARSKTGFTLTKVQPIQGRKNGASILSENVPAPTITWDGTNTDTISHATIPSPYVCSVAPYGSFAYYPRVSSVGTSSFNVQYYDYATDALYTGASRPSIDFLFNRGGQAPCALTGSDKMTVERTGPCKVNATNVSGASSNLWIYGMFEV